MAKPVFLLGYMGCGKSTTGKKLASKLKFDFVDTDAAIESMTGKSIGRIFIEEGEEAFRALEHSIIRSLANRTNIVVATGGGTPCFHDNLSIMNRSGITVYLKMQPVSLAVRIKESKTERPVLHKVADDELPAFIAEHLDYREKFYSKAHLVIKGENLKIDELVNLVRNYR